MSNECATLAQKRKIGSATRKAVLMYLADRASDDGSGIWTSKAHIAADTELSRRAVQKAMTEFEQEGILMKVGTRPCKNGYTYEYRLNLAAIRMLPGTRAPDSPVHQIHMTRAPDSPQDVHQIHPNHPITIHEPSSARERAGDLFSANSETDQKSEKPDDGFDRFWAVYPKKAGKPAAQKAWAKAIKREKPEVIIAAAKRYAAWLSGAQPGEFRPQVKYAQGWLNDGRWDEFTGPEASEYRWDDLSPAQQRALADGKCPPSMLEDGKPNEVAAFWLEKHRRARA
jgi:biotin operon repressor